jgi:hypothetical protein
MKAELDLDVIKGLYEFGGLIAYKVIYFDPVIFKVVESCVTFDEKHAKETMKSLQDRGFTTGMDNFLVKFNNAFAKNESVKPKKKSTFYNHVNGFLDCSYLEVDGDGAVWYHSNSGSGRSDITKQECEKYLADGIYVVFNPEEPKYETTT